MNFTSVVPRTPLRAYVDLFQIFIEMKIKGIDAAAADARIVFRGKQKHFKSCTNASSELFLMAYFATIRLFFFLLTHAQTTIFGGTLAHS